MFFSTFGTSPAFMASNISMNESDSSSNIMSIIIDENELRIPLFGIDIVYNSSSFAADFPEISNSCLRY